MPRAASQFGVNQEVSVGLEGETEFVGYECLEANATVVALYRDGRVAG